MIKVAIDAKGQEWIYYRSDERASCPHNCKIKYDMIPLPAGTIEKILGRKLRTNEEPVELKK